MINFRYRRPWSCIVIRIDTDRYRVVTLASHSESWSGRRRHPPPDVLAGPGPGRSMAYITATARALVAHLTATASDPLDNSSLVALARPGAPASRVELDRGLLGVPIAGCHPQGPASHTSMSLGPGRWGRFLRLQHQAIASTCSSTSANHFMIDSGLNSSSHLSLSARTLITCGPLSAIRTTITPESGFGGVTLMRFSPLPSPADSLFTPK
jgi:hypothetical protein